MKKIMMLMSLMLLASGCASFSTPNEEELRHGQVCEVWKEGMLGRKIVSEETGELAQQKSTCWVMNMWLCSYTDYTFRNSGPEILSSAPPADKAIGRLEGKKLSISMTGATVQPFELGKNRAEFDVEGLMGHRDHRSVEYNSKCSDRQVALGILSLMGQQ